MSRKPSPNQSCFLDHHSRPPQTKIVCSLRPSTDLQTIKHLLLSGMNVARIACAFGTQKELEALITRIRDASTITKRLCGIILETHGTSAMVGPVLISPKPSSNSTKNINSKNKPDPSPVHHNKIEGLQLIASTLNLEVDNLPQHILQNAAFAVKNILNQPQNTPERKNKTKNKSKNEEKPELPEMEIKEEQEAEIQLEEKKDDSFIFPFAVSPRRSADDRQKLPVKNNPVEDPTSIHHDLSSDGSNCNFILEPDIYLIKQSTVRIITDRIILGDRKKFSICFPGLCNQLSVGKHILIHPSIKLEIKSIDLSSNILTCLVLVGGRLKEYSKVEFPSLKIYNLHVETDNNNSITQQDVADIGFGIHNYVDYICISHCASIVDINKTKEMFEFQMASIRNMRAMKRNTSYNTGGGRYHNINKMIKTASGNAPLDDMNNNIKILAKIEDSKCLNDIDEIITECDGIIIDYISLWNSMNSVDINKDKIKQIVGDIILESRKQAKPVSICCDITTKTNLLSANIFRDLKLLNSAPTMAINASSFLTFDDICCIEDCVAFGADSICLLTDINRLVEIFSDYYDDNKEKNDGYYYDNYHILYLNGIIKSVCNIIKNKEELIFTENINNINNYLISFMSIPNIIKDTTKDTVSIDGVSSVDSYSDSDEQRKIIEVDTIFNSMASSAVKSAFDLKCSLIIVLTQSGRIARIVSKYRPHCTILAITDSEIIAKQCMFISSIFPVLVLNMNGTDSLISRALYIAYKYNLIKKKNDKVVVLAGTQSDILDEPCDFIMKLLYVDL